MPGGTMFLLIEVYNKKTEKYYKDIGFGTSDYRVRILNTDEKVLFDSEELISKKEESRQKENDTD